MMMGLYNLMNLDPYDLKMMNLYNLMKKDLIIFKLIIIFLNDYFILDSLLQMILSLIDLIMISY
jgi:hypothetical protein